MLEIRPNCECCDKDLAPNASDAMICTYECTFCKKCVEEILHNVCPNCGGGFENRPIRPANEHRVRLSLKHQPPSEKRVYTKYSIEEIVKFSEPLKKLSPLER